MNFFRVMHVVLCFFIVVFFIGCSSEPKVGKVEITETSFFTEKDGKHSQSLNVTGKVKNVGSYDIKNIVITGECDSCNEIMVSGKWFATKEIKTDEQKSIISYLTAGAEEKFTFNDIAYLLHPDAVSPENYPDELKVYIVSFETVQD